MKMPITYGKEICEMMMRKFEAAELPPKGKFHYHQGVFLSGVYQIYKLCKEEKYFEYIKEWVDSIIDEEGEIHSFDPGMLDDIQPGILLYPLLDATKDKRYQIALDTLLPYILNFNRNEVGGLWHKVYHPDQMWLDGLYMAGPISVEYAVRYNKQEYLDLAIEQALLMRKYTEDKDTGLWYHAWDCSKRELWADKETGRSSQFWGRSIGWVPVAILDELDFIDIENPKYGEMCSLVRDLLTAICKYQSKEGRWYQVVDKGGKEGNWLENSCSCLYVAAICKAVSKGILDEKYIQNAKRGYQAVINTLTWEGKDIQMGDICVGTGVGDYEYYCNRKTSVNDLHGLGAFLIMCAEMQKEYEKEHVD